MQEILKIKYNNMAWCVYWNFTILWFSHKKASSVYLNCKCICWKNQIINYQNLRLWKSTSCWCKKRLKIEDYVWKKIWKLSIINYYIINNKYYTDCICECGKTKTNIYLWRLINWWNLSCWCVQWKNKSNLKHGMSRWWPNWRERIYRIWIWIKSRTEREKDIRYKDYGWRWIKCEWKCFKEFKEDMYDSYLKHVEIYWEKQTTIDRIDNDWNYYKENCKWSTIIQQANNRRNSLFVYNNIDTN
jgi:hypothetical protein